MAFATIQPYLVAGDWVFDDDRIGLEMIDDLVKDIPNAAAGFNLVLSTEDFPGKQRTMTRLQSGGAGGHWYRCLETNAEGELCPSLLRFFDEAPLTIYVKAEPKRCCLFRQRDFPGFKVQGVVMTDDQIDRADFEVEPYLEQVTFDDLKNMMLDDWGMTSVFDKVALFFRATDPDVDRVLKIAEASPDYEQGVYHAYGVIVDGFAAMNWIKTNRPDWYQELRRLKEEDEKEGDH